MSEQKDDVIKVVLLGDSGVGKSSIVLRFVTNEFRPYSESTIGASFMSKKLTILAPEENEDHHPPMNNNNNNDNTEEEEEDSQNSEQSRFYTVNFKIWDTAGQEKYHSLAPLYYRGAGAAILVYDICNQVSFESLKRWVSELKINGPAGLMIVICGNKIDMKEHRQVDSYSAQEYAQSIDAFYIETSCRDDINIERIFKQIGTNVVRTKVQDTVTSAEEQLTRIDLDAFTETTNDSWLSMC